ncbi:MAG: ADP-ribosylglycohydrolase family protein [Gudongella sp.]|nr:ADP-ribosylglycohydrolase family protein [Gudongella sp.]
MRNSVLDGIMGLCVADALGVPVEFMERDSLRRNPVVDMRAYGTYNQPAGTWSDDTSMTLCLLDSLSNGLDYEDIMMKFLAWFNKGEYSPFGQAFDIGNSTRKALMRFEQGTPPLECGGNTLRDNGNGSLMRILPIVFYLRVKYGRDFVGNDEAFQIIHNISGLTHAHKRSQIACGIYISIASEILEKKDLYEAIELGISKAMEYYRNQDGFMDELHHYMRIERKDFKNTNVDKIKSSGYVVETLEAAIWCLLNTTNYKDCVLKAVNLGEDTDTVAAVAGGLAGLYYGYSEIPMEWLEIIVKKKYVEKLCDGLGGII